jgi:hypothetical protein
MSDPEPFLYAEFSEEMTGDEVVDLIVKEAKAAAESGKWDDLRELCERALEAAVEAGRKMRRLGPPK